MTEPGIPWQANLKRGNKHHALNGKGKQIANDNDCNSCDGYKHASNEYEATKRATEIERDERIWMSESMIWKRKRKFMNRRLQYFPSTPGGRPRSRIGVEIGKKNVPHRRKIVENRKNRVGEWNRGARSMKEKNECKNGIIAHDIWWGEEKKRALNGILTIP